MRRVVVILTLFSFAATLSANSPKTIRWQSNYNKARSDARRNKKPLLIDFAASWCGPCRLMEETTFTNREVITVLNQMVCARIDIDQNSELATQFEVSSIPRIIVIDSKGETVVDAVGYQDAEALLSSLESSASSLQGIRFPKSSSGSLSTHSSNPIDALVEDLGHSMRHVRERADRKLRQMKTEAVSHLLSGLNHEHLAVRIGAYTTLSDMVKLPSQPAYDPWARKATRDKAVDALKQWWSKESQRE